MKRIFFKSNLFFFHGSTTGGFILKQLRYLLSISARTNSSHGIFVHFFCRKCFNLC